MFIAINLSSSFFLRSFTDSKISVTGSVILLLVESVDCKTEVMFSALCTVSLMYSERCIMQFCELTSSGKSGFSHVEYSLLSFSYSERCVQLDELYAAASHGVPCTL